MEKTSQIKQQQDRLTSENTRSYILTTGELVSWLKLNVQYMQVSIGICHLYFVVLWVFKRLQNYKDSLKACIENVNISYNKNDPLGAFDIAYSCYPFAVFGQICNWAVIYQCCPISTCQLYMNGVSSCSVN